MPTRFVLPSGNAVEIDVPDERWPLVGDARARIAAVLNVVRARVRLTTASGMANVDDAAPLDSLGEQATVILLHWEPWDVAPFSWLCGSLHPDPLVDGTAHGNAVPRFLSVRAVPRFSTTWEDFLGQHRGGFKGLGDFGNVALYREITNNAIARAARAGDEALDRLAAATCPVEVFWGLCDDFGLQGLRADDTATTAQSMLQHEAGMDLDTRAKLQQLLLSLERRCYYGNVLFPDAFETIDMRVLYGTKPASFMIYDPLMMIFATESFFWCIEYKAM